MAAEKKIRVKNTTNGVESEFTEKQWADAQNNPQWAGVFTVIEQPTEPKEVTALKDKAAKAATAQTTEKTKTTGK